MLTQREIDEMEYRALRAQALIDEVEAELQAQRGPDLDDVAVFFVQLLAAWVLIVFVFRLL